MNTLLLQAVEQFVENLNNILHRSHYEVTGSLNENGDDYAIIFSVSYNGSEEETMPTIELGFDRYLNQDDHEMWAAIPTLTFPTLSYSIENDYADTIQYHLDHWAKLGENITDINRADFDFTDFSEQNNQTDEVLTSTDINVQPGDEEITYLDTDGMFGEPGEISLAEIKEYWSREHEYDPSLSYYDSFDEWFNDTRQWLSSVERTDNVNSKEDIEASYEYSDESEGSQWKELSSKMVPDSDGFYTDYTLYESMNPELTGCAYICMFGDKDVYKPDAGYADMEFDDLSEAEDWFYSYEGLLDEDEIFSSEDIHASVSIKKMMSTISRQSPRRASELRDTAYEHGFDVNNIKYFYTSMNDTLGNVCVGIEYADDVCAYVEHGEENRCTFDEMIEHIYQSSQNNLEEDI